MWKTVMHDLRYGLRVLVKNPECTLIAVLTLAPGVGACTAIFSVVDALLRPLPHPDAEEIVRVWEQAPDGHRMKLTARNCANFHHFAPHVPLFDGSCAFVPRGSAGFVHSGACGARRSGGRAEV
jgi:hypothetical protein